MKLLMVVSMLDAGDDEGVVCMQRQRAYQDRWRMIGWGRQRASPTISDPHLFTRRFPPRAEIACGYISHCEFLRRDDGEMFIYTTSNFKKFDKRSSNGK